MVIEIACLSRLIDKTHGMTPGEVHQDLMNPYSKRLKLFSIGLIKAANIVP